MEPLKAPNLYFMHKQMVKMVFGEKMRTYMHPLAFAVHFSLHRTFLP